MFRRNFPVLLGGLLLLAGLHTERFVAAQAGGNTQSNSDELLISVQGICPVSGQKLGSMGKPIKVKLGQEDAFLCCKGCLGKQAKLEHWKTIQKNIAAAQQTCPIMGKPVNAEMKYTVVGGQRVYVCCPPCIEKIQRDPATAINKVRVNYDRYLTKSANAQAEALHIAAQRICPVSGQKLGSMGKPIKVQVGEEHVYVCCKGCLSKQIQAKHWQTIQSNLAQAQGVCPVMGKKVDASMKSTVVNGRKIFVCCPPCIEKIKARPEAMVAQLNRLYQKSLTLSR